MWFLVSEIQEQTDEQTDRNMHSLWESLKGFSIITSPNLNGFGWNLEYKCGTTVRTCTKIGRKSPPGVPSNMFCFFFCHQYKAAFLALLHTNSAMFKTNRFKLLCRSVHFQSPQISLWGLCKLKKTAPGAVFGWCACYQCTAQTALFHLTGIISGASRHPKDVPFERVFWCCTCWVLRHPK